jgi:hypothetical protein
MASGFFSRSVLKDFRYFSVSNSTIASFLDSQTIFLVGDLSYPNLCGFSIQISNSAGFQSSFRAGSKSQR